MKYKFFYVPNTHATLLRLVDESIPVDEARRMLGKVFGIQFVNPIAEPAVYGNVRWDDYAHDGAMIENYAEHGVQCWTVPMCAVELRETRN
jgi:hypothetical protein